MRQRDAELAARRAELESAEAVRLKAPEEVAKLLAGTAIDTQELSRKRDERDARERERRERERREAQAERDAIEREEAPKRARLCDDRSVEALTRVPGPLAALIADESFDPSLTAVRLARTWAAEDAERGLVIRGGVGNGKSVAAACAVAQFGQRKFALSESAISWHRPNDFASGMLHSYDAKAPHIGSALVVIDDIGRETKADFEEALVVLIDDHLTRFVLTTNLTVQELSARYGERLVDRLHHECQFIALSGTSRRRRPQ
jgi:DNA replication protein DnaC